MLALAVHAQAGLHEQYGGVKPDVARDAHAAAIAATVEGCLQEAGVSGGDLTAVAVTVGPGLSLCLQVGGGAGACGCGSRGTGVNAGAAAGVGRQWWHARAHSSHAHAFTAWWGWQRSGCWHRGQRA